MGQSHTAFTHNLPRRVPEKAASCRERQNGKGEEKQGERDLHRHQVPLEQDGDTPGSDAGIAGCEHGQERHEEGTIVLQDMRTSVARKL